MSNHIEVRIGKERKWHDLFFDYDEQRKELHVGVGEEIGGMCEQVHPEAWVALKTRLRLFERLESFAREVGAVDGSIAFHASRRHGDFVGMAVWGSEADDSPMAGAAAHGVGDTLVECLDALLRDAGE